MNSHAILSGFQSGLGQGRGVPQNYECVVSYTNALFLPHLTGRQQTWSNSLQRMFERENSSCKSSALSLGLTPELLCCAACCPCTDMSLVRVSSICALCNISHLSCSRSATALQSQNLVNTNHIYSVTLSASWALTVVDQILSFKVAIKLDTDCYCKS